MTSHTLPAEGGQALRNMSAPPRSTLTLKPFQVPAGGPLSAGTATNWGMAWHARVDLDLIFETRWPRWVRNLLPDIAMSRQEIIDDQRHLRLCGAVALARTLGGHPIDPGELEAELGENLGDELLALTASLAPAQDLPALLLVTTANAAARPIEEDPLRALIILTHLSGRTCDPGGSSLLSEALLEGRTIDLWAAEARHD